MAGTAHETDIYKEIGLRIREARRRCGDSQTALATRIGVSRTTITRYEDGSVKISLRSLLRIADCYGRSLAYFLGHETSVYKGVEGYHTLNEIRQGIMKRVYGRERDFGVALCAEIHTNGLTFDTLAAKWEISLPLLGALVADHCYKLTGGIFAHTVDDEVHTVEEYHSRFDFGWKKGE